MVRERAGQSRPTVVLKCREVGKGEALRTLAGLNTVVIIFMVAMVLGIVADAVEGGVRDEEQAEVRQESDAPGMRLAPMSSRVPPESDGVRRRCAVALRFDVLRNTYAVRAGRPRLTGRGRANRFVISDDAVGIII